MHESMIRLNLYAEEICLSCVSITMLHLPFYVFEKIEYNLFIDINNVGGYTALGTSVTICVENSQF